MYFSDTGFFIEEAILLLLLYNLHILYHDIKSCFAMVYNKQWQNYIFLPFVPVLYWK